MIKRTFALLFAFILLASTTVFAQEKALHGKIPPKNGLWLEELDLSKMMQGWKKPQAGKSVIGFPITLGGEEYIHGIGTSAGSQFAIDLKGVATAFMAMVGVDDETQGKGSVTFEVWLDGKLVSDSGVVKGGGKPTLLSADLTGGKQLVLLVSDAGDGSQGDHADWAGATLILNASASEKPEAVALAPDTSKPELALGDGPEPAIHGPRITGATPGRPFLFLIPATGEGPLSYSAKNLPAGLALDSKTGIITGALETAGKTNVELTVAGPKGSASRTLTIVGGERALALTPPLGWNSWNVWGIVVEDQHIRDAADCMIKSGLAAHGFQYVNIDDTWEADRGADGVVDTNKRFKDMNALTDYVHSKGLKIGIYSSPGPKTCAGYTGSYQFEEQDAETYALWGFDYLKYDWCSYGSIAPGKTKEDLMKPYRVMREALDKCGRDIVYSLCQYGMGDVWTWGAEVGGNLWRTTSDIVDTWDSVCEIGFSQNGKEPYAGPGHWNDPDMLVIGSVGWGLDVQPSRLTPHEQHSHITLWCLLAAPLLIGCDMSQMDPFTLALLTNDDVLDVNQDPLGKQACRRAGGGWSEVWAKEMSDGTLAVGLFNRRPIASEITARWEDLGLKGPQPVRDLWRKKDLGQSEGAFTSPVPPHGAVMLKIGEANG